MNSEKTVDLEQKQESSKQRRERSTIEFPYSSLDDAVAVAQKLHEFAGNTSCDVNELAAHMGLQPSGGGFRLKMSTARAFGLTQSEQRGTLQITELGNRIVDPRTEKQARADAFLTVPLYKAIYDSRKGGHLPNPAVLEREMVNLGVAPKQKAKARQAFERSAREAGFINQDERFSMPPLSERAATEVGHSAEDSGGRRGSFSSGGTGGGSGGLNLDPLLMALLRKIPAAGAGAWAAESRLRWFRTFAMNVSQVYDDDSSPVEFDIKLKSEHTTHIQ